MLRSIQEHLAWRAVPIAGLAGGTIHLLIFVGLAPLLLGVSGEILLGYFASFVLGADALVEQNTAVLLTGVLVHYVLSIIFALVIAVVVHRWGLLVGILGGTIVGVSLYGINLYTMTLWFPWFYAVNSALLLSAHIAYGAVTGGVYEMLDQYDINRTRQEVAHEG